MTNKNQGKEEHRTDVLRLPADSAEFVEAVKKDSEVTAINPYLSHNHFYQYVRIEKVGRRPEERKESLLFEKLRECPVCESAFCRDRKNGPSELKNILDMLNERNRIIADYFPGKKRSYIFKLNGKLICGMGGDSPYGNIQLFRLHHVFGIPYIPASVIKGSLRNYIILEDFSGSEEKAEETAEFRELFGTKVNGMQAEGKILFFDAFPSRFEMGVDVQTPHFKKYYEGENPNPLDDEDPVPLFFTCLQNAEFQIHISCREAEGWEGYEKTLARAMKGVFEDYGIGAKTSLGYGIGKLVDESFSLKG